MNKWKTAIISLGITVLFAIACYFMPERIDLLWTAVISVMTFLISFVFIELLEHTRLIRAEDLNSKYNFFKECGISEYQYDFSKIDFAHCISASSSIKVVLLYSNRFIKNNINVLREFVAREGSTLEIILLSNNKDSFAYKFITEKFGYEQNRLSDSLSDFKGILKTDLIPYKHEKSSIKLYFTELIPSYAVYAFDNYAYITLYKTTPERTNLIPCFRVEKAYDASFLNFILNDFEGLKKNQKTTQINL